MNRLRRSELAVPGSSDTMLAKAAASDADLVFCDLEDAVAPEHKDTARENVIAALTGLDWGKRTRAVRINAVDTPWVLDDLVELIGRAGTYVDVIIVPKVQAARDVWFVETLLDRLEVRHNLAHPIGLEILIEETRALACVEEIARSSSRLEALIVGYGDLSASQGMRLGQRDDPYPGDVWHYARARVTVAARAAGLEAIDGPYPDYRDAAGYRREATRAATMGMTGKWAIHPNQIAWANDVFAPTDDEVALARTMCDAYHEAASGGRGAAGTGGVLVDAASARLYQNVLDRAAQIAGH